MASDLPSITEIAERSDATPSLFNTRYAEIDANFDKVPSYPLLSSEVGVTSLAYPWGHAKRHGVAGDGATDDTDALTNWVRSVVDNEVATEGHRSGYLPAGRYVVRKSGLFSDLTNEAERGVMFYGDGMFSSIISLETEGNERWIYDNGATRRLNYVRFRDMCFETDSNVNGNGFKWTSGSPAFESAFLFDNCAFREMAIACASDGSTNADNMTFMRCVFFDISQTILQLENPEGICYNFYHPSILSGSTATFVKVVGDGGGEVNVFGGVYTCQAPTDGLPRYLLYVDTPGTNVGIGNGQYCFHNVKSELRDALSRIISTAANEIVRATFYGCGFNTTTGSSERVTVGRASRVKFVNCTMPQGTGNTYSVGATANITGAHPALLEFEGCSAGGGTTGADLAPLITVNTYGQARCRGWLSLDSDGLTERRAYDFDLNWRNAGYLNAGRLDIKLATIKTHDQSWPSQAGTNGREQTVKLPYGCFLKRIYVRKDTSAGGAATYQLHVGNDDKTTIYGSSLTGAQSAVHEVVVDDIWLGPLTTDNERIVRLWSTNDGADVNLPNTGAAAIVEYV